jgi:hypothetical protein
MPKLSTVEKWVLAILWLVFLLLGPSLASTATWIGPIVALLVMVVLVVWTKSVITREVIRYVD